MPPDSDAAAVAPYQEAGLPMRIAVAMVSGFSTGMAEHNGSCAGGLETEHPRQVAQPPGILVLPVPLPVRNDVAGVAHRHAMYVGGITQNVDHLERTSFLALNSIGVYGVHHRHRLCFRQLTHERQRAVEISPYLHDFCAVHERLGQLA